MKRLLITPLLSILCLLSSVLPVEAAPTLGGAVSPDGKTTVQIDLPKALRHHNTTGVDGYGLCVFWSITHAARWQQEGPLLDFAVLMEKERGGGWPEKVDKMIAKYAATVDYLQYIGRDAIVLTASLKSNRLPSVTYCGRDPHYRGTIAHMVNLVHLDDQWACILDNNYIGENDLVWMTPSEFFERWRGKGSGWAVVLLKEPPDPPVKSGAACGLAQGSKGGREEPIKYVWYYHRGDPYRVYLYCHDELIGGYDFKENYFRYYVTEDDQWLSKTESPFPPPKVKPGQPSGEVGHAEDYGIPLYVFPPRNAAEERWTRRGQPTSREALLQLLQPRPPTPAPQPQPPPAPKPPDPIQPGLPSTATASGVLLTVLMVLASLFAKEKM
jgi:hypothetical protein